MSAVYPDSEAVMAGNIFQTFLCRCVPIFEQIHEHMVNSYAVSMEECCYEALKYMIPCETLCSETQLLSKSLVSQFLH